MFILNGVLILLNLLQTWLLFRLINYFTPHFFLSYQAASAYGGKNTGGLATGMIGAGVQTSPFLYNRLQGFAGLLVGAGGGGGLALAGGSLIEPVLGVHYALTPALGFTSEHVTNYCIR